MLRKKKFLQEKPQKREPYFGKAVQQAIIEYNSTNSVYAKNKLYSTKIGPAFSKLSENLIYKFKFFYINDKTLDTQNDVIMFLLEKLHHYTPEKGKAYSYFTIVARNYLIINNSAAYKEKISKFDTAILENYVDEEVITISEKIEFMDNFVEYLEYNLQKIFPKRQDYLIADAIITLIKRKDYLPIINKKALYLYLREITDKNALQITRVLDVYKNVYNRMQCIYLETDELDYDHIPNKSK